VVAVLKMKGVRVLNTPTEAVEAAARLWAEAAHEAVRDRGSFRVALSGGRTPKALFFTLAKPSFADLPWDRTEFFWGDERYAPISHGESNFRSANDLLLKPVGAIADRVHGMPTGGTDPVKDAERYEEALRRHFGKDLDEDGFPVLDLALQGLGTDGHTASLFPGKPALAERKRWVLASRAPGSAPIRDRLTLTAPVLRRARKVLFLITGEDKADAVREFLEGDSPSSSCPAKLLAPLGGERLVLLDREAAKRLKSA
jgi:6-phosphogluconolactonase